MANRKLTIGGRVPNFQVRSTYYAFTQLDWDELRQKVIRYEMRRHQVIE